LQDAIAGQAGERLGPLPFFENQASETGLFGGIVNGSVCPELMSTSANDL
jgi:hypothetical protein